MMDNKSFARVYPEVLAGFDGRVEFVHRDKDNASSAYELCEELVIRAYIRRAVGAESMRLVIYPDGDFKQRVTAHGLWCGLDLDYDVFKFSLPSGTLRVGLYFAHFELNILGTDYESCGSYSSVRYVCAGNFKKSFQISITDFKYVLPKALFGGIIYHIFVDRFNRGGRVGVSKDAVVIDGEWDAIPEYPEYAGAPMKNNTFYGGTLFGIIDKLDYIASLGVSAIYLSPIFLSPSNHKYDTSDYMTVDPMFGGESALSELVSKAKERGIGIILDGVFNHTGADSIYFNKFGRFAEEGAYASKSSPYYEWYSFAKHPDEYTCWWGIDILPRIDPDIASCREYFVGADGVIEKYARLGILGMRLDVADELSDSFIRDIKKRLSEGGATVLYGEVWEDGSNKIAYGKRKSYYLGDELDGVMNYPLRDGLVEFALSGKTEKLLYALEEVLLNAPRRISELQMNLLGSHDTVRILTLLGDPIVIGDNRELRKKRLSAEQRLRAILTLSSLYTILATLPGVPAIYYGDEAGLEGYGDPFNRMPYPWGREESALLEHYRRIGSIRRGNDCYFGGGFKLIGLSRELLVFSRNSNGYKCYTIYNNSNGPFSLAADRELEELIEGVLGTEFKILPRRSYIFKAKEKTKIRIKKD